MAGAPTIKYLSPAETAKALGLSVRALRLYEQKGLVRPIRSRAGWRAYGPEAVARLHQVLALKRLGFSLGEIGGLLSGHLAALESVLELQERALACRREEIQRGLALIRSARARLARGEALSVDDLTTLTRETTMTNDAPDWVAKMQPFIDRRLNDADQSTILQAGEASAAGLANGGARWATVIADAKALVGTDPAAPAAQDVARRWRDLAREATGGDPALYGKMGQVWREALTDPGVAPELPFGLEVWTFVGQAMARLAPEA